MPMSAAQICTISSQVAKVPGMLSQAGMFLTSILSDLNDTVDLDLCRKTIVFPLVADNGSGNGAGPYPLPSDYLRSEYGDVFFTLNGVPYQLAPSDLYQWDSMVITPGLANYPTMYATNLSIQDDAAESGGDPYMLVWPPSSGAYPLTVRYRCRMPEITTPQTSSTVPWFPNQNYLVTRLSGELMRLAGDDRWEAFLGDEPRYPAGAQAILRKYLMLANDQDNRAKNVKLDMRRFRRAWNNLPQTKLVGW